MADISKQLEELLLSLRSRHGKEENLKIDSIPTSPQLPESRDVNRPEPKPSYVINATPDVTKASSPSSNRTIKRHQRISFEKIDKRRLNGLCLFCEEPETPDHYLRHKNLGILMIDGDEDQSCDDEELVEMEVVTESNGIEVNKQRQFQVPVSKLEHGLQIHKVSTTVCEDSQYVAGCDDSFDHQKSLLQVSHVKARDELLTKSIDVTNNQAAHYLFDKMPLRVRSKMRRSKCPKCWRFKFKNRDLRGYNLRRVKLLPKNSLVITEFERKKKKLCLKTWTKVRVRKHDNLSWKEDASDESRKRSSRCIVKLGGAVITSKNVLEKNYDENLEIVARSKRPGRSEFICEVDDFEDQESSKFCKFVVAFTDLSTVAKTQDVGFVPVLHKDAVLDSILGCTIVSGDVIICYLVDQLKPEYVVFLTKEASGKLEQFSGLCKGLMDIDISLASFYVWLMQTSWVIQQVMRNKKIKFSKRWWFKYKEVKEGIQRLQILLWYKSRLEFKGKGREVSEELSYLTSREILEDSSHYFLLIAAAHQSHLWSAGYRVWHRWKARCFYVGMISTMRAWLFGEGGFDIGNEEYVEVVS